MAEAIGVTASLIGIATFAFQLSKEVYDLVDGIHKAPQTIRELKSELVALDPILNSIQQLVTSNVSKFEDIRYPLYQCGMVCFHLRSLIRQCTEHSASGTRSARDWVKMQYKGKTIDGYKGQLASYKATIGIALSTFTLYVILVKIPAFANVAPLQNQQCIDR
jgi:Fungal N-terminal domain of STAND proteins